MAQNYLGLEDEIVLASAGGDLNIDGANIDFWRNKIPANVVKELRAAWLNVALRRGRWLYALWKHTT